VIAAQNAFRMVANRFWHGLATAIDAEQNQEQEQEQEQELEQEQKACRRVAMASMGSGVRTISG